MSKPITFKKYSGWQLSALLFFVLFLGACKMPAKYTTTLPAQNLAYTAAAATIVAQLTDIANPATQAAGGTNPAPPVNTLIAVLPSETLPATSTPLPTKTLLPSDTLLPSNTPLPSPTQSPTLAPSKTPENPEASLGNPTWTDSFLDGTNWPLYNDQHTNMEVDEGKLTMIALIPNGENPWDGWMVSQLFLTDFYLTVTATTGECSGLDRYGLLARAAPDASQSYIFGVSCDGKYSLRIWNGQRFVMLVEWTASQFINQGAQKTNQLGFKAEGNELSLYANGNLLSKLEDDTFSEGAFGLFIGAVKTAGFTIQFDEIAYWDLP